MKRRTFLAAIGAVFATAALEGLPIEPIAAGYDLAGGSDITAVTLFEVGDVFTIAGVYALNPITLRPTTHLQPFIVTATQGGDVANFHPHRR